MYARTLRSMDTYLHEGFRVEMVVGCRSEAITCIKVPNITDASSWVLIHHFPSTNMFIPLQSLVRCLPLDEDHPQQAWSRRHPMSSSSSSSTQWRRIEATMTYSLSTEAENMEKSRPRIQGCMKALVLMVVRYAI